MNEQPNFWRKDKGEETSNEEMNILSRHSLKPTMENPESKKYPGLSEEGVELAKQKVNEIIPIIEQSEEGSVIVFSGVSDLPRTRSTLQIYGEETVDQLKEKGGATVFLHPVEKSSGIPKKEEMQYLVFNEESIASIREQNGSMNFRKIVDEINQTLKNNPQARLIALFPLRLKQFHDKSWDRQDEESNKYELGPYATNRINLFKEDKVDFMKKWIEDRGIVDGQQIGPDPEVIAKNYQLAIKRMNDFIKLMFPENKGLINFMVAHEFELDAFVTSLVNDKKISEANFDEIRQSGGTIGETEMVRIEKHDNNSELIYRGKRFNI